MVQGCMRTLPAASTSFHAGAMRRLACDRFVPGVVRTHSGADRRTQVVRIICTSLAALP